MKGRNMKVFTPDFTKAEDPSSSHLLFENIVGGGIFIKSNASDDIYLIGIPTIIGSHTIAVSLGHLSFDDQLDFANADCESPVFMEHTIILGVTPRGHIIFIGDTPIDDEL